MDEELVHGMSLDDKRSWLDKHGRITGGGIDPVSRHIVWETHGGMKFPGIGANDQDMYTSLFNIVTYSLFLSCRDD